MLSSGRRRGMVCASQRSKCRVEIPIMDLLLQEHEQNLWAAHELL